MLEGENKRLHNENQEHKIMNQNKEEDICNLMNKY